jgi:hypothetical protein
METKEYLIPIEWVMNAHVPVKATSLQEAVTKVGLMSPDQLDKYSTTSDGYKIREELIDELNPEVPQEELDSLVLDDVATLPEDDDEG